MNSGKLHVYQQQVESIRIYKEGTFIRTLKGKAVNDFIALIGKDESTEHIDDDHAVHYSVLYQSNDPIILKYDILEGHGQYVLVYKDWELSSFIGVYLK
ncbi:hypothetical protein [Paenibacillus campi]|uniref:hypothetical protein n=1 Tax=Paenibacillus campi TaxID=3106031 RepID=UPI002AFE0A5F|nr:hypothetical protein [Paenibacillus sp. SGZ-1014]